MKRSLLLLSVCVAATAFLRSLASADEIVFPARQIEQGKGAVSVYLNRFSESLSLRVTNTDEIKVNGISYFSDVSNDFIVDGKGDSAIAKFIVNPWSGLSYWFKAGIGSYELEIPSVTVRNRLSGQDYGIIAGIGARSVLLPETIVTPALALDLGITYRRFDFNSFQPGDGAKRAAKNTFELTDLQAAVIISKKFDKFEPYGGLKVARTYAKLFDEALLGEVSGTRDYAGAVAGAQIYPYPHESLFIEGAYAEKASFTFGWKIDF